MPPGAPLLISVENPESRALEEQLANALIENQRMRDQLTALGCSPVHYMTADDYAVMYAKHAELLDQVVASATAAGIVPPKR